MVPAFDVVTVCLTCSDAVLAGASAAHGQSPESHLSVDVLTELVLVRVVRLEKQHRVEVAVADVTKQRS